MRGRSLTLVICALLVASLLLEPVVRAAPVGASPVGVDIDLDEVAAGLPLILDLDVSLPRHILGGDGEIYVTADDELLVIDLDGDLVGLIEDLPGAGPMALSPDGESLFVGLRDTNEVALIDVEELTEEWSWDLPATPRSVRATDELLQVGVSDAGSGVHRRSVVTILADEDAEPVIVPFPNTPLLASDDAGLVIGHAGVTPGRVSRRTPYGDPVSPALERTVNGFVRDIRVDPVTGTIWVAPSGQTGSSYRVLELDPATLETTRSITIGAYPSAVLPIGDGRHVAAARSFSPGDDVTIHRLTDDGATQVAGYDLPGHTIHQGVTLTEDGTLAVLTQPTNGRAGGWLTLLPEPQRTVTDLAVDATAPIAGQPIDVTGALVELGGTPVAGATVSVLDPRGGQTHAITDGTGRFSAAIPASPLGVGVTVQVAFVGDADRQPVIVEQRFTPRRGESSPDLEDRIFIAGQTSPVRGRVLGERALLRPGVPVTIEVDGEVLGTTTSDADGTFSFPITVWSQGQVTITARTPQDDTHLAGSATWTYGVQPDRPIIRIDAASGTARSPVTVTGHVRDGQSRPVADQVVDLELRDDLGFSVTRRPTTDAQGRWTATVTPRQGGSHRLTARTAAGNRFSDGLQTRDILVARAPTTTTLSSLPTTVEHGATLTLVGRVTTPPGASLDLVAIDLASGAERRIARAQVDSTGRLTRQVTARANTRYEVRYRGDASYAPSTAKRTVKVRAAVTAQVSGHDRTVDGVRSYPYAARPTVTARVRSANPGGRVHVLLQQRREGAWVTTIGWYARPDADGRVTTRVPLNLVDGRYRVRVSTGETRANLQGHSPWVPLRVRR